MKESIKKFWHENWYDIVGTGLKILGWGGMIAAAYFGAKNGAKGIPVNLDTTVYLGRERVLHALMNIDGYGHGRVENDLPPVDTDPVAEELSSICEELDHLDDEKEEEE